VRETVEAVTAIAPPTGIELRPLADKLNLDKSNVSRRLARAADGGYVRNLEDKRGKPGRWVVGDPLPEAADLLPNPAQLRNSEQQADQDRCGVAADSDGKSAARESERETYIHTRNTFKEGDERRDTEEVDPTPSSTFRSHSDEPDSGSGNGHKPTDSPTDDHDLFADNAEGDVPVTDLFDYCQVCGNPLVWEDSQLRGTCSTCWVHDEHGAA